MATDPVELARSDLEVDAGARAALDRIQTIDFRKNFALATASGRSMASMLADVIRLRRGPGRLTSDEYYYYRLWDPALSASARRRFVGKLAQAAMHHACNREEWRAAASDKLLFAALMAGARLPSPDLLAIVHPHRAMPGIPSLRRVGRGGGLPRGTGSLPVLRQARSRAVTASAFSVPTVSTATGSR